MITVVDLRRKLDELGAKLDAQRQTEGDMARVRQLVIEMRRYVLHHGILIGECVAWEELKKLTGVGQSHDCPSEGKG